jgi:hypothetical protein
MDRMALRKLLKAIKDSLIVEQARIPKTMLGNLIHRMKIYSMKDRIAEIETELLKRKTKKV